MKLPAQLAPWRDWLALLPAELAAPLGQMLLRLRPLGHLALVARVLHALLAHLAQGPLRVALDRQFLVQLGQLALQFAFTLNQIGSDLRLPFTPGPKAQSLHLFKNDFLLARLLDALEDLRPRRLRIAHATPPTTKEQNLEFELVLVFPNPSLRSEAGIRASHHNAKTAPETRRAAADSTPVRQGCSNKVSGAVLAPPHD